MVRKFLMTGAVTIFTAGFLVGCGDTVPNDDKDEKNYLDESQVEVEVED